MHEHMGPQFHQLPMFMEAHEIVGNPDTGIPSPKAFPIDIGSFSTNPKPGDYKEMWAQKRQESVNKSRHREHEGWSGRRNIPRDENLATSIQKEGIRTPISLFHHEPGAQGDKDVGRIEGQATIWNGHHRAIMAHDLQGRNALVPVQHMDEFNQQQVSDKPWSSGSHPNMMKGFTPPKRRR